MVQRFLAGTKKKLMLSEVFPYPVVMLTEVFCKRLPLFIVFLYNTAQSHGKQVRRLERKFLGPRSDGVGALRR